MTDEVRERVARALEPILWERDSANLDLPNEPGMRAAWAAGSMPDLRRLADAAINAIGDGRHQPWCSTPHGFDCICDRPPIPDAS